APRQPSSKIIDLTSRLPAAGTASTTRPAPNPSSKRSEAAQKAAKTRCKNKEIEARKKAIEAWDTWTLDVSNDLDDLFLNAVAEARAHGVSEEKIQAAIVEQVTTAIAKAFDAVGKDPEWVKQFARPEPLRSGEEEGDK